MFIFVVAILVFAYFGHGDIDQYYDDYYDEVEVPPDEKGIMQTTFSQIRKFNRISLSELFLNITSERYDCILRKNSFVLALEPENETVVNKHEVMEKHVSSVKEMIRSVQTQANAHIHKRKEGMGATKKIASKHSSENEFKNSIEEPAPASNLNSSLSSNTSLSNDTVVTRKKLSYRERLNLTILAKKEREKQREKIRPKFRLGADCETLLCASCKIFTREISTFLQRKLLEIAITERPNRVRIVENALPSFCRSEYLTSTYKEMVPDMCLNFENKTLAVKEVLLSAFEDNDFPQDLTAPYSLYLTMKHVCVTAGVCSLEDFTFVSSPQVILQEQWDDRCFVCQAVARDMEGYVLLLKRVSDKNILWMVAETCNRLVCENYQLEGNYDQLCREMTSGKLLKDVSWFAKVHAESVIRKDRGEMKFSDHLCEEIDWCQPWIDPEVLKDREIRNNLEEVFF